MNPILRLWGRITEFFTTQSDVISRTARIVVRRLRSSFQYPSHDWGRPDYPWWRRAYYCRVRGLEISGLLIKPLVNKITAWVLGIPPTWTTENESSSEALNDWWREHQRDILNAYRGSLKQGDMFMVINPDLSVSLPPPETVDPIVAEDDYSNIIGWRVTQTYAHPERQDRMTVIDEFYVNQRVRTTQINGMAVSTRTYDNPLGLMTVVHISNMPDEGETFGHAEAEAPLEVLHRYGEVFEAAIEGNINQGRPTPVANFATIQDLDKFWDLYGSTSTQTNPDGTVETINALDVDLSQLLTLSGADFEYKSPGPFTQDTERILGLMFYLILEYSELPEFVFGNAIASSKASTETQMPVFERFIEMRRSDASKWMTEVAKVVLGLLSMSDATVPIAEPTVQWKKLTQDGRLTLDTLTWAVTEGLVDDRTALMLSPLDIQDVDEVLETAKQEREERQAQMQENQPGEENFDEDLQKQIDELELGDG